MLFTIGYEGRSIETYFALLQEHHVQLLADVRYNPISRKPGFSKKQLQLRCEQTGIEYRHFPELGIPGTLRKDPDITMEELFNHYKLVILPAARSVMFDIFDLLTKQKRIALTCFEADVNQCHRKYLAEALKELPRFDFKIEHI